MKERPVIKHYLLQILDIVEKYYYVTRLSRTPEEFSDIRWRLHADQDEDSENELKESEWLFHFIIELWTYKEFAVIKQVNDIIVLIDKEEEAQEWLIPDTEELVQLINNWLRNDHDSDNMFLWAKGYACLYEYETATTICEDILNQGNCDKAMIVRIREKLIDWYDMIDDTNRQVKNKKILFGLIENIDDKTKLLQYILAFSDNDQHYYIQLLKNNDVSTFWEMIYEHEWSVFREDQLAKAYEEVRPQCILPLRIYQSLWRYYLEMKRNQEAQEILSIISGAYPDEFCLEEIEYLIQCKKWDAALERVDSLLQEEPGNNDCLMYKGKILCFMGKYHESIQLLTKATKTDRDFLLTFRLMVYDYVQLNQKKQAIALCKKASENTWYSYYLLNWVAENYCGKAFLVSLLEELETYDFENHKEDRLCVVLVHFFRKTQGIAKKERGYIRYNLLRLYVVINDIKNNLRMNKSQIKKVYHYSKEKSLRYLPCYSEDEDKEGYSVFRLNNVAYLNDPLEGKAFYKVLDSVCGTGKIKRPSENTELEYQNAYIACFSLVNDSLPMWVQYAEDGKGCCYEIDTAFFDDHENRIEENIANIEHCRFQPQDQQYVLYNVFYFDENNPEFQNTEQQWKLLGDMYSQLQGKGIDSLVQELINSIRYLVKDVAYKTEEEVRVVCMDYYDEKCVDWETSVVPRFYLELNKPIRFSKVVLGPKASNIKTKATYLNCCSNVDKVEKSQIQYD